MSSPANILIPLERQLNGLQLCRLWIADLAIIVLQFELLFCVRMMSPVPCALWTMMLCLLKLMKHILIWSLLLYWRHSTWLGKFSLWETCQKWLKFCNNLQLTFDNTSVSVSVQNSKLQQLQMTVWLPVLCENGTVDTHTCVHPSIHRYIHTYTVSKTLCKFFFIGTSSNFQQLWYFFTERWQTGKSFVTCTHLRPHLIRVTTLPC